MAERTKKWMISFGLQDWRTSAGRITALYNMGKILSATEPPLFAQLSKQALPYGQIALS